MRKHKSIGMVRTKEGFDIKVWFNRKTGTVLPTNWKQQAGYLASNSKIKVQAAK